MRGKFRAETAKIPKCPKYILASSRRSVKTVDWGADQKTARKKIKKSAAWKRKNAYMGLAERAIIFLPKRYISPRLGTKMYTIFYFGARA